MTLDEALSLLAREPTKPLDLAEVSLLLSLDETPSLDLSAYQDQLDLLAAELEPQLPEPFADQVETLSQFLFEEKGFHGNEDDYYDPRNSYLNEVLDRRTGIPITLSILAIAIAERVGIQLVGVGLPGHFIVKAIQDEEVILFDPFHGGAILTLEDCRDLVERVTHAPFALRPEHLEATPNGLIVMRMLNNLKGIYLQQGDFERSARVLQRCCQLAPDDSSLQRDLGIVLFQIGRHGLAIDHLNAYLQILPEADDSAQIKRMLQQARKIVAQWN